MEGGCSARLMHREFCVGVYRHAYIFLQGCTSELMKWATFMFAILQGLSTGITIVGIPYLMLHARGR